MPRSLCLIVALVLAAPLAAQEVPADSAREHGVRRGDTLWDLAAEYLGDPFRWPEIYELNRDVVKDPDLIYPRDSLRIPGYNYPASGVFAARDTIPPRTVFFPEEAGPARSLRLGDQDVPRAVVTPGDFYRAGFLAREREVAPLGHLVEVLSPTVLPVTMRPQIGLYDELFLKLAGRGPGEVRVGDRLHLWRPGRAVPPHGQIFASTGQVVVLKIEGEVATVQVDQLYEKMQVGDLALPVREFTVPAGDVPAPADGPQGRIVAFDEPHALHSVHDLAFVDLGEQSGVREGDELEVVLPPERQGWGTRPAVSIARLRVVRAEGTTSAARVIHLEHPALQAGLPVRLVGKMP